MFGSDSLTIALGKRTRDTVTSSQTAGTTMQDEAEITISGVKLTDAESMTVRVAIDTLANVLAEGLEEQEGRALTEVYLASLTRIQTLLESRKPRTQ
jgi:hypothetical protein